MTQWMVLAAKGDNLSPIAGTHMVEEKINSWRLSSGLHGHTMVNMHMYAHIHTNTQNK